jgi:hypothetical protein
MKRVWVFYFCLVFGCGSRALAGAGDVRFVSTQDYFPTVKAEIDRARKSVTACLYLFSFYPNNSGSLPFQLADALAAARGRGVRVEVVLNGAPDFSEGGESPLSSEGRNRGAYDFLRGRGIEVSFSSGPAVVHAKAVVVDEEVVILGSSNWTEAAMTRNVEANILVRNPDVARSLLAEIGRVPRRISPEETISGRIPVSFLTAPKLMGAMTHSRDERAFDVYLYALKAGGGAASFNLAYDPLADSLGITDMGRTAYRRQITKTLVKLQDEYGLIRTTFTYGGDARVEVVPSTGDAVGMPADYWTWGWNRRLGFQGKVMYVLNRCYSEASPSRPRWSVPVEKIARDHGLAPGFVRQGTTELRRANLVAVEYDELAKDPDDSRRPNIYTPLPLYDPAELDRAWAALGARYGGDALARGRACAHLVYADSDADAVERFIMLEMEFGREKVQRAYDLIAQKNPDNPRRCVGYFIGTVQGLK